MPSNDQYIAGSELLTEKNRLLYQSALISSVGILLNVVVLVVVLWAVVSHLNIIIWSGLMVLSVSFRFICLFFYNKYNLVYRSQNFWYKLYLISIIISAMAWALVVVLVFPVSNIEHQTFIAFIFAGVSAASITTLSYDKRISYIYIIIMLSPLALRLLIVPSLIADMMGIMVLVYLGILISSSSRFNKQFINSLLLLKEAEHANEAKSKFLSSMSHELRTPLNAILGFSKLMIINSDENKFPESYKENLNEIVHAGEYLLELINDVLEISKIETDNFKLKFEYIDFLPVVEECIYLLDAAIKSNNNAVNYQINDFKDVFVYADYIKLKQVLLNLLSNAIKYNKQGGVITIKNELIDNGLVRFSVKDAGMGLTEIEINKLFIPFERLGQDKENIEGTGVGLVISKNLMQKMNGSIWCESIKNKSCTFFISLPGEKDSSLRKKSTIENEVEKQRADKKSEFNQKSTKDYRVLYIEDDPTNIILMQQLLESKGIRNVVIEETGKEGLETANSSKFDLLLLDINLPDMSGLDIAKQLKSKESFKNTPIIAVSANAMPDDVERGKASGVDCYLVKPINFNLFDEMLNNYLFNKK